MEFFKFFNDTRKKYNIDIGNMSYIISKVLDIPSNLIFNLDKIDNEDIEKVYKICELFCSGMPLNKIFCEQNFYGFDFFIDNNVLAPRPETEILVETAIKYIMNKNCNILDICCGSGCIGLSIKKICPQIKMTLSDISQFAINTTKKNAQNLNVDVEILQSDMFNDLPKQKFDYILSNPPYIKNGDKNISKEVLLYDPHIALFGGDDGLKFYKIIFENTKDYLVDDGKIIIEIGYDILQGVLYLAKIHNLGIEKIIKDYSGIDRIIVLTKGKVLC